MNIQVDPTSSNLASAMLNSKIRPRAVVGYGVKIFHLSPPNYVTRSPGDSHWTGLVDKWLLTIWLIAELLKLTGCLAQCDRPTDRPSDRPTDRQTEWIKGREGKTDIFIPFYLPNQWRHLCFSRHLPPMFVTLDLATSICQGTSPLARSRSSYTKKQIE